jgi:flagellar biosynthesis/type III secretory pathway protein FliH
MRRIALARVSDKGRFLLLHYVATYVKLKPEEEKEYRAMLEQPKYAEARDAERTWSEELWDAGEQQGIEKGYERGEQKGSEKTLQQSLLVLC